VNIRFLISRLCRRLAFAGGLAGGLALGWLLLPGLLYSHQEQPLAFNHAIHTADEGMACDECHPFRDDGSFAGIPPVTLCADCHEEALGESEAEARLIEAYLTPDLEIPWFVYARQPQNVYFSHAAHVTLAEIDCDRCHGPHGATETLVPGQTNRISTYSRSIWGPRITGGGPSISDAMKMSDCSDCHARNGVQDHCLMCHK